jgi:hypothetical protein
LLEGRTLKHQFVAGAPLQIDTLLDLAIQIAGTLGSAVASPDPTRSVDYPSACMYHDGMPDDKRTAKRRWERRRVQMTVTLVIEGDEAEFLGNTVDLSPQGLCLQSEATLALGQPVGLLLGTEPNCFIKARVVWVGKADSAQAGQAGFEFLSRLQRPVC